MVSMVHYHARAPLFHFILLLRDGINPGAPKADGGRTGDRDRDRQSTDNDQQTNGGGGRANLRNLSQGAPLAPRRREVGRSVVGC